MKIIKAKNWSFKWSKLGVPGRTSYVAMFSAPHLKTNMVYSYDHLRELLAQKTQTTVPQKVLVEALQAFLQEQISRKSYA